MISNTLLQIAPVIIPIAMLQIVPMIVLLAMLPIVPMIVTSSNVVSHEKTWETIFFSKAKEGHVKKCNTCWMQCSIFKTPSQKQPPKNSPHTCIKDL
jgi:hypothetical protein